MRGTSQRRELPLESQAVHFEAIPEKFARVLVERGVRTWADVAAIPEAVFLTYSSVGPETIAWLRGELATRRGLPMVTGSGIDESVFQPKRAYAAVPVRSGVYFIRCGPFVKIGLATNARRRFVNFQQVIPFRLEFVGIIERVEGRTLRSLECEYHARFKHLHHVGEWFREEGELAELCAQLSQPKP